MPRETLAGIGFALSAFVFWGALPIYFKAVAHLPALEVLAHRVVWSIPVLVLFVTVVRGWHGMLAALRDRRTQSLLAASTLLLAVNWLVFIWAINNGRVLEISLGYYINPLVNVALGVVVLRERLGVLSAAAVGLAALGVLNLVISLGALPWASLTLAASFGVYGLIRKTVPLGAAQGLLAETVLLLPFAVAYLLFLAVADRGAFATVDWATDGLLLLAGVVTAVPLVAFAAGARRLDYATVGLFQYIAPSGHFLLAIFLYGETFKPAHMITFALIWLALVIRSIQLVRTSSTGAKA